MKKLLFVALMLLFLSACGMTKKDLGLQKKTPDASVATEQKDLILPPNYNLRPVVPMTKARPE